MDNTSFHVRPTAVAKNRISFSSPILLIKLVSPTATSSETDTEGMQLCLRAFSLYGKDM